MTNDSRNGDPQDPITRAARKAEKAVKERSLDDELDLAEEGESLELGEPGRSGANMAFGMVDLAGSEPGAEAAGQSQGQPKPGPPAPSQGRIMLGNGGKTIPRGGQPRGQPRGAPSGAPSQVKPGGDSPSPARPEAQRPQEPRRIQIRREEPKGPSFFETHTREIKIGLFVLAILAVIAGAIFGIVKWRQAAEAEKQAELDRLDQRSLDSLKDDTVKKEKYQ